MISVGLLGASGRMGTVVTKLLSTEFKDRLHLIESPLDADVVIDFSLPAGGEAFLKQADGQKKSPCLIVGSTGWSPEQLSLLEAYAKRAPVLMASNFSVGVLMLQHLLYQAAALFRLGYQAKIVETHHVHKKDAPSGTALSLQKILGPNVPIQSKREGEVVGDHSVDFSGPSDRITLTHSAGDRAIFARGAIQSALWLCQGRKPGSIYSLQTYFDDVLAGRWTP